MGDGVGAAGDLAAAGVLASALDNLNGAGTPPSGGAHAHHCANCGATLAGAYCQECGQAAHVHRSMLHLVEEFFHGLLHFDGKVWRTLPLLAIRPGLLTRRYVHGHRVRYVSPLALFLFCVFVMFFALSLAGGPGPGVTVDTRRIARAGLADARAETEADIAAARQDLAAADRAAPDHAPPDRPPLGSVAPTSARTAAAARLHALETRLAALDAPPAPAGSSTPSPEPGGDTDDEGGLATTVTRLDQAGKLELDDLPAGIRQKIRHALKNPELALYKIKESASKLSFILVPISVPFIWVMFLTRRDCRLYDHVVFALHSLSFMAVWVAVLAGLHSIGVDGWGLAWLAILVPPAHMGAHLRGAYHLSLFGTLWRTSFLLLVATFSLLFYVLVILSFGLAD